jgi:sarcosine oxidase
MRIAIIGVGGVGSMAAWRLAEAGHEVVAFEQFAIDHDLGSSYGGSRIVRQVYPDPYYTNLMVRSFELWDELQAQWSTEELIVRNGGLFFGPRDHLELAAARQALSAGGVAFSELTADDVNARYPGLHLAEGEGALFEPGMGYARASSSIKAAVSLAKANGVITYENSTVKHIDIQTDVRLLVETGEQFSFDRVIVTAGPWINDLLAPFGIEIPLEVTRQVYCHLQESVDIYSATLFPVWIDCDSYYYGFPKIAGDAGVKIGWHVHGERVHPNRVNRTVRINEVNHLIEYASKRLPGLSPAHLYEKVCLYSNTPDEDFVVDLLPSDPRVVIVSACSGHGFKFVPLVGEMAKQLALRGCCDLDISRFSLSRF